MYNNKLKFNDWKKASNMLSYPRKACRQKKIAQDGNQT